MKAVIPAAGHGTRFLPVTRAVPKEMLPIGAKPAIQLIVEEALAAGADEVVIVISPEKEIIRGYFKDDAAAPRIKWAYQLEQKGLGHAVLQAAPLLEGEKEPVLVLLGDALVSGEAPSAKMVEISRANGGASVVGLERVPPEKVSRYGIVKLDGDRIVDLVEKPKPEDAPSDLAIAGRYLLDPAVFELLATQQPGHGGEIQLTDSIRRLVADHAAYGYVYPGRRQDIGTPEGYLKALKSFAGEI